jgi:hypothetical protein
MSIINSIIINGIELLYNKSNGDKYIITYTHAYNSEVDEYLERIFNGIFPLYDSRRLQFSNTCGDNAEYICKNLKISGVKLGKIIITEFIGNIRDTAIYRDIESVYGNNIFAMTSHYHALVYLEITIDKTYYIAIETTICKPYKLQFYIGNNMEELTSILKTRYHCKEFKISYDCDKSWDEIAYGRGGKKQKTKKQKTKKQKNKKTKKQKKQKNKKTKKQKKQKIL